MNHICFFVILVTISLYLSIGRCSTIDKRIISAPDSCLSHAECPASDFCQTNTLSNTSFTCVSRFKKDDVCNSDIDYECESTLFCSSPSAGNNGRSRCRPRSVLGQPCLLSSFQSCAGLPSVVCSPNTKTCVEAEERNLDEDCTSTSCNQTEGLFCDGFTCNRKSTVGGYCEPYSDYCDDTSHCANPFTPSYNINYNTYMCLKSAVAGQKCSSDEQCNGDELICNKPKASEGKCIDASQRIAKLGQPCNPALDKCDSRRGLSCRYLQKGHHVCMHRVVFRTEINYATVPYCSPMNKYSRCTPRFGRPTECRLLSSCEDYPRCEEAALDQTYSIYEEDRHYIRPTAVFPSCHEKQRLLGQGSLCNMYENEICGHGLRCDFVPNIQETANDVPVIDGKSVKKTAHCVKVVSIVNGNCSNPFRHKCDAGLQCVHGLCKRSTKAISKIERQPKSHLGIYSRDRCDTSPLPCAPGLDCTKEGLCDRPIRMVSNGRPCFDTSTHKRVCKDGTVCRVNSRSYGILRCRDPAEAGGFCRSDNDCESELRCSLKNKCFNSSLSLNVGDSCNPKATTMEKKCKESTDEGFGKFKLKCLENDGGEYMCHRVIDQFQACDFIKSQPEVCDEGLVCLSLGYYSVCAEQLF